MRHAEHLRKEQKNLHHQQNADVRGIVASRTNPSIHPRMRHTTEYAKCVDFLVRSVRCT